MNPWGAVRDQSLWTTLLLVAAIPLCGGWVRWLPVGATSALLAWDTVMAIGYAVACRGAAKRRGKLNRTDRRRQGDMLVLAEGTTPLIVCLAVTLPLRGTERVMFWGSAPLAIAFSLVGIALVIATASSFVDWWYIRPRRDGVVRLAPCRSSGDREWKRLTKAWLLHRFVAEAAMAVTFAVTPAAVTITLSTEHGFSYSWIINHLVSPLFSFGAFLLGVQKARVAFAGGSVNRPLPFALGDTLDWHTERREKWTGVKEHILPLVRWRLTVLIERRTNRREVTPRYGKDMYVFDVGLDHATLFNLADARRSDGYPGSHLAPISDLFIADIDSHQLSPCKAVGRCLQMHSDCAVLGQTFDA